MHMLLKHYFCPTQRSEALSVNHLLSRKIILGEVTSTLRLVLILGVNFKPKTDQKNNSDNSCVPE